MKHLKAREEDPYVQIMDDLVNYGSATRKNLSYKMQERLIEEGFVVNSKAIEEGDDVIVEYFIKLPPDV